jgi:hypothetical protein
MLGCGGIFFNRAFKSINFKHENTGAGLSHSGKNGQWSLPY